MKTDLIFLVMQMTLILLLSMEKNLNKVLKSFLKSLLSYEYVSLYNKNVNQN